MDPDQAHRKLVKAAYDAAKAKLETNKQRMSLINTKTKLGEQSICVFLTIDEGN